MTNWIKCDSCEEDAQGGLLSSNYLEIKSEGNTDTFHLCGKCADKVRKLLNVNF